MQWGTVPEWFSMIGTLGAFGVGGVLLWREIVRNRAAEKDRVREQASRVIILLDEVRVEDIQNLERVPSTNSSAQTAVVRNASDLPIYRGIVVFIDRLTRDRLATRDIQVVPPHDERRCVMPEQLWSLDPDRAFGADVIFFDAADRRWHRRFNGALRRLPATSGTSSSTSVRRRLALRLLDRSRRQLGRGRPAPSGDER
jgi:hypothetical protein